MKKKTSNYKKNNTVVPVEKDEYVKEEDDDRTGEVSEISPREEVNLPATSPDLLLVMEHSQHAVHTSYHDHDTPYGVDRNHRGHQQVTHVSEDSHTGDYRIGYRDSMDEDDIALAGRGEPGGLTVEEANAVREITSALEQCLRDT